MPFAFWKNSKTDEKSPLLSDGGAIQEWNATATNALDLDMGGQDSGSFSFEDMEQLALWSPTVGRQSCKDHSKPTAAFSPGQDHEDALLRHDEEIGSHDIADGASPFVALEPFQTPDITSSPSKKALATEHTTLPVLINLDKAETLPGDRDSAIFLTGAHATLTSTRPASVVLAHDPPRTRLSSFSRRQTPTTDVSIARQRTDSTGQRLHRPTELNLSSTVTDGSKPQTELEKRFNLMRNSKSQSKAALRSPTALLEQRLNMSPRKSTSFLDAKVRVFVPPQPSRTGCLLPGPAGQSEAFTSASVRAQTGAGGRPAWWCKTDKLVVFDSIETQTSGEAKIHTRTSKGLSIARRRGDTETIIIPMDCEHCQEMLNRHEWKYDIQVCKRSVCWDCKERCKWELEQEQQEQAKSIVASTEGNRYRADSVLQDEEVREEDLMYKIGIEQGRPKSPAEAIGGIEERMMT